MVALYKIGAPIWNPLIAGIVWLLVSIIVPFLDFSNAGSILVCCAIISEMYHSRWYFRDPRSSIPGFSEKIFEFWFEKLSESSELKAVSRPIDYSGELWHPLMTVARIDRIMEIVIIAYLIVGTIIWGYGNAIET